MILLAKLSIGLATAGAGLLVVAQSLRPPPLTPPPQAGLVLADVTVVNPGADRHRHQTVVVDGDRIVEVRAVAIDDPKPICAGCFVLPGLIDAHVHTPPHVTLGNQELFALLHVAHGVTTVRDVGASDASVGELAQRLRRGELVGPRMQRCGPVLEGDPPAWPVAEVVTTPAQGRAAVHRLADEGVDCIKVYNEIRRDVFAAVSEAAAERDLPVLGHVPHDVGLAGVRDFESQHFTGVPYVRLPRPPVGWDIRNEDVLAMSTDDVEQALAIASANNVSFTPTLANFRLRLSASDPDRFPPPAAARWLPTFWTEAWDFIAGHPTTTEAIAHQVASRERLRQVAGRARALGIDVLAGTDTLMPWVVPGDSLHRELTELATAFGSNEAALESATSINAAHLAPGEIGRVAAGYRADLLVVPADPTVDLDALRAWRIVVADGRRYDRPQLDAWLHDYAEHFRSPFYSGIMNTVATVAAGAFSHE